MVGSFVFRNGSLKAEDRGECGGLGARKGVAVKAETGLSLERRSFSRTKVDEE